jgi:hypothetical protein
MFDIQVDASRANVRLEEMPEEVRDALIVAVTLVASELEGAAQSKVPGDLLQVRTAGSCEASRPASGPARLR